jgi:hypothetical protein
MLIIAGVTVKAPSDLKIGRFDITKSNRSASGKMAMDIIAPKKRLDVTWKMIKDSDLKTIIDTITAHKPFFTLEYPDVGGQQSMICYSGDITTSLWHTIGGVRYWDEVQISFIQQ